MKSFKSFLTEKAIVVGNGARYGQIIFLAGGAGSGKGFAIQYFLEGNKFKVRDVDEWKKAFLKIAAIKRKYPKLRRLNLRKPDDVAKLHDFVDKKGIKDKTLTLMLSQARKGRLPNIIFDITLKKKESITKILPLLMEVGYNPRNIHLIWVLTNYYIAVEQNKDRDRIVPDDILLDTHEGAANTMWQFVNAGTPATLDGSVHVVLGGRKHTVFWKHPKTGREMSPASGGSVMIRDFKYLTVKDAGANMEDETALKSQILDWIRENAPRTKKTAGLFGDTEINEETEVLPDIYCDMDQVLANFLGGAEKVLGKAYTDKSYWMRDDTGDKKKLLQKEAPNFFKNLEWMSDGKKLWNYIQSHEPRILSAFPSWHKNAKRDKSSWVNRHLGVSSDKVHLVKRPEKRRYAVSKKGQPNILIDDHPKNIKEWQAAGGIGILHRSADTTIKKLKKMGF